MKQQAYYEALLSKKQDIEQQIDRKREILQTSMSESTDELSSYDQHPGDMGTDTFEREKEVGLLEMLEFEMKKINDALSNYQNDSYGVCEQCGKKIEPARLRRLVNTTLCAACARSHTEHFHRPAEEDVVRPGRAYNTGFDIAGYSYDEYKGSDSKVQESENENP